MVDFFFFFRVVSRIIQAFIERNSAPHHHHHGSCDHPEVLQNIPPLIRFLSDVEQKSLKPKKSQREESSAELSWDLQTFAQRLEKKKTNVKKKLAVLEYKCHFLNLVLFTIVFMHFLNVCHCILYNATLNS